MCITYVYIAHSVCFIYMCYTYMDYTCIIHAHIIHTYVLYVGVLIHICVYKTHRYIYIDILYVYNTCVYIVTRVGTRHTCVIHVIIHVYV